jgi:hypothetical protein
LLQRGARDGVTNFELALVPVYKAQHELVRGDVAQICYTLQDGIVLLGGAIVMVGPYPKEAVFFEPVGLMDLEIETNRTHGL